METLKNEIRKIFRNDLIHKPERVEIEEKDTYIIVKVKENATEADFKELKIEFPKEIEILPLLIDKDKYYTVFNINGNKKCECAILVKENDSYYLTLVEMKSTLRTFRIKKLIEIKEKFKCSLYVSLIILKLFDIIPKKIYGLIPHLRKETISPTTFDIANMDRDSSEREFLKEWESSELKFEWIYNTKIVLHKREFNEDSINWAEINTI
ncbi:hypothetical protein [Methanotorris igneus]|uniref:Uncharacterized protein n=1 Tax=Methanotorris igneus (strain DSM 5666 / JCM 11834 / Kol 5) TaxID=880724 RepID=F6BD66_METIK|nr:hypothetical protein [Methanotorris igneus]AEF96427.1 hypothetical protein Metig_0884 [Methanotorris igneus Kol 5]